MHPKPHSSNDDSQNKRRIEDEKQSGIPSPQRSFQLPEIAGKPKEKYERYARKKEYDHSREKRLGVPKAERERLFFWLSIVKFKRAKYLFGILAISCLELRGVLAGNALPFFELLSGSEIFTRAVFVIPARQQFPKPILGQLEGE